eukprot:6436277-Prymnesium_polylepis.2
MIVLCTRPVMCRVPGASWLRGVVAGSRMRMSCPGQISPCLCGCAHCVRASGVFSSRECPNVSTARAGSSQGPR